MARCSHRLSSETDTPRDRDRRWLRESVGVAPPNLQSGPLDMRRRHHHMSGRPHRQGKPASDLRSDCSTPYRPDHKASLVPAQVSAPPVTAPDLDLVLAALAALVVQALDGGLVLAQHRAERTWSLP